MNCRNYPSGNLPSDPSELACRVSRHSFISVSIALLVLTNLASLRAIESETIGLTAMRRERPAITGAGIAVAQPEGIGPEASDAWEVAQFVNFSVAFTWTSDLGTSTNYTNTVGSFSSHAFNVGLNFYGVFGGEEGVAPGIPVVDNYEAGYYINTIIVNKQPTRARVINQSFILNSESSTIDLLYDDYATIYNVLFVSGMSNIPDQPHAPGTAYNGLGVGFFRPDALSSVGPTSDGRCKPDLVAPNFCCTSFATPQVAGGAALLLQAGTANDGGSNTASLATNSAVVKALLINGAVKTTNWTNGVTRPLDARYGAGVLNVYHSDRQLRGGRRPASDTNSVTSGTAHLPTAKTNNVASLRGWDFSNLQSPVLRDGVAHYYFNLPTNDGPHSVTTTLVWKKNTGPLANLDLFLYDTRSNTLILSSTSSVDNVEHLFIPKLAAGRYDLQVLKRGDLAPSSENYALAFDFSPVTLAVARSETNAVVSWPASPAGFLLQAAPSLTIPITWQTLTNGSILSNGMSTVTLPASEAMRFFRLFRP